MFAHHFMLNISMSIERITCAQVHSTIRAVCYYHISNRIPPHSLITMQDTTSLITTNHIKIEISKPKTFSYFFFIVFCCFPSVFMCTFKLGRIVFYFHFTHDFESNEPQLFNMECNSFQLSS